MTLKDLPKSDRVQLKFTGMRNRGLRADPIWCDRWNEAHLTAHAALVSRGYSEIPPDETAGFKHGSLYLYDIANFIAHCGGGIDQQMVDVLQVQMMALGDVCVCLVSYPVFGGHGTTFKNYKVGVCAVMMKRPKDKRDLKMGYKGGKRRYFRYTNVSQKSFDIIVDTLTSWLDENERGVCTNDIPELNIVHPEMPRLCDIENMCKESMEEKLREAIMQVERELSEVMLNYLGLLRDTFAAYDITFELSDKAPNAIDAHITGDYRYRIDIAVGHRTFYATLTTIDRLGNLINHSDKDYLYDYQNLLEPINSKTPVEIVEMLLKNYIRHSGDDAVLTRRRTRFHRATDCI